MKIEKELLEEQHRVRLTLELESEHLERAKQRAARKLSRKVRIPGFRPGKAPYAMVARAVGEETIVEEAVDMLLNEWYPKALEEAAIEPYGPGTLKEIASLDPPRFVFEVPLEPEVELGDYRAIRKPYQAPQVSEEEVQQTLENLREMSATIEPVDRPAQEGDLVYVLVSARLADADPDDPDAILYQDERYPLIIPTEQEAEEARQAGETLPGEPYPGFARELLGMAADQEKTLTYTYPDDAEDESLQGKTVQITVKVEEVKARRLPEIDDDFARQWSEEEFETAEDFIAHIRGLLQERAQTDYDEQYIEEVLEEVIAGATIKFPPEMLEKEVTLLMDSLNEEVEAQGMTMEQYLEAQEMDADALREKVEEVARQRLRRSLVLDALADAEQIQVAGDDEVAMERMKELFQEAIYQYQDPKEALKAMKDPEFQRAIAIQALIERVIELTMARLKAIASGQAEAEAGAEAAEESPTEEPAAADAAPEEPAPETE